MLLLAAPAAAQDAVRYVSDEISITMRAAPGGEAAAVGSLGSGAKLEVLESKGGYARVRTADGREGWVAERFLKAEPHARVRAERAAGDAAEARAQLAQAQAELKKLQDEQGRLMQDVARLAEGGGAVSPELAQEADRLRTRVQQLEQDLAARDASRAGDAQAQKDRQMLLGGGLVVAGVMLAMLFQLLFPRRRW